MGDTTNMKFFVLACLVAAAYAEAEPKAEAEADPALLYSTYGYHYPSVYSGLHHPYVYGSYYRPYGGYHYLGKRSAEAEPKAEAEADPALLYSTCGYGYPSVYSGLHHPYVYGSYYRPYAGYHYLGKRSAEAEPTADPEADPYLLYGYGYPHAYGYAGLHHPYAYSAYHYRPYGYAYWG